ncbi:GDSL esterase/lipase 7-like [Solanum dulcamara]|uniref:GDSL esterase/lipase 7-like n=1 Tax=Solanum dulcamara TaxID=45834 RepID=UPI0024866778|nr:GDSL esterase/lipase 7-like [Solanum dulcamara]
MWYLEGKSWVLGTIWYVGLFLMMDICRGNDELLVFTNGTSWWPSSVTSMYILGDSSVDCGDNTPFYPILHQNLSLNPCNGSDQTLLPQILAKKMGLNYVKPFYSQNGSMEDLLNGVNFGAAQATIMYPRSRSYQSLNQQLRQAFETIQLLQLQLGQDTAKSLIESSLFYLSFGKDDLINYLVDDESATSPGYSGLNFTHILVDQMINVIENLYNANVRKIVCMGVLPLGCSPSVMSIRYNSSIGDKLGCENDVNLLVLEYNTRLEQRIVDLSIKMRGAQVIFCDTYRAMMEFIFHPQSYGFEDAKNACCGAGEYGGTKGCLSPDMACPRASNHVWWDLYNPTEAVNILLANSAWSGDPLPSICRPITFKALGSSSS